MDYVHISIAGFLAGEILHSDDNFSHCTFRNETPCEKLSCVPQKITYNYSDANKNHDTLTCHLQSIYPEILSFGIARRKKKSFWKVRSWWPTVNLLGTQSSLCVINVLRVPASGQTAKHENVFHFNMFCGRDVMIVFRFYGNHHALTCLRQF